MYFLSRIELNIRKRGVRKLIGSPAAMHAAVEASMAPSARRHGRMLWRLDMSGSRNDLYVVSPGEPDFSHIVEQAGWETTGSAWKTRDYGPFLSRLSEGDIWAYRFAGNPTRSGRKDSASPDTQRFGHVTASQQTRWFVDRSLGSGFELLSNADGEPSAVLVARSVLRFGKRHGSGRHRVTIGQAVFEGYLRVTDKEALRSALIGGIGPAKAYGCGLMTLAPAALDLGAVEKG